MLPVSINVHINPWPHTVPDATLIEIIMEVGRLRAEHVQRQFEIGAYKRPSFGLAILNPAAPLWTPSADTLLATIAIGDQGPAYVPNGIAKAIQHRDHGQPAGYGAKMDLVTSADGEFCYGYSSQVDETIGGGSAASEIQDACEVGHALVTFNYMVRQVRREWLYEHPDAKWFCNQDEPGDVYKALAMRHGAIYHGATT